MRKQRFGGRAGVVRLLAVATVAAAMGSRAEMAEAQNITWANTGGVYTIGSSYNCFYMEPRMQAYVGYGRRPGNNASVREPAVGEVWYAHLVISHPGVDCAWGGSPTGIHFVPPPNTQLAVSAGDPLFCFWRQHNSWQAGQSYGTVWNMAGNCNQNPPWVANTGYSLHAINPTQVWTIPQWSWMEFLIPLRSSAPVSGLNNTYARVNPELNVWDYPAVSAIVNNEVIFRDGFDPMNLYLDLCGLAHTANCG